MKTAISLPDALFEAAERLAERLGLSRSELYAKALAALLSRHSEKETTEKLNALFDKEESKLDPALTAMQLSSLPKEDW